MRRYRILPGLLFLISVITMAQTRGPVDEVKLLMESCRFSQAIRLVEPALEKDSAQPDLLLLKGRALASLYRYREAIAALKKALLIDSTNIRILNELADAYRQLGDSRKALTVFRKINTREPANTYFTLQIATLCYSLEDYLQAVNVLLPSYKADSGSFFVAKQLGNCYHELNRPDSAIMFYRQALRITPYDPNVTGKLVNLLIHRDEVALALYWTQRYLMQDSSYIPIRKQCGYCYYLLIDFVSAAKQFHECARLGDSSKFTMKYLGLSYYKQQKYDSAAPCFHTAFQCDTSDAEVCFYYGVSAYRSLDVNTGLKYLNCTLRLLMPSGQFLSTLYSELADANTSKGNADTAVTYLGKALEANPANNTLRFKIAYQYDYHLRKPFEALPYYREFLKNSAREPEPAIKDPQKVSYEDYSRNRIREITSKKK